MKRFIHAVFPALLLSMSVGQIYAFTLFSSQIAETLGKSQQSVQFAFSLGIFFLGMGAAFFGKIVERNIKLATIIGSILFLGGMYTSHCAVINNSLTMLYLGYGLMLGLGTGIIYISPVKTMMMWFPKNKAVAAAVPIIGFGLGSSMCTLVHDHLATSYPVSEMFEPLTLFYIPLMVIGSFLLKKPGENVAEASYTMKSEFSYKKLFCDRFFWHSWSFMLINISAGLCLIPLAKQMMTEVGYETSLISAILVTMGLMNGGGRFVFAWWSDRLVFKSDCCDARLEILAIIIGLSICAMIASCYLPFICCALIMIPACYGAGFSTIPAIVYDHYGISNVSTIHGAVLSAWGFAGLIGNQLAMFAMNMDGLYGVIGVVIGLHLINWFNVKMMRSI